MVKENMSKAQKLTFSAMIMALYIVVLYFTQSFSFGAYQIRIATSLYGLSYLFPFLVLPLGFANFIANMLFGGLGLLDMFGGCIVGIVTTAIIVLIRRQGLEPMADDPPDHPCAGSRRFDVPFLSAACALQCACTQSRIGQTVPAICGAVLVNVLQRALYPQKIKAD